MIHDILYNVGLILLIIQNPQSDRCQIVSIKQHLYLFRYFKPWIKEVYDGCFANSLQKTTLGFAQEVCNISPTVLYKTKIPFCTLICDTLSLLFFHTNY